MNDPKAVPTPVAAEPQKLTGEEYALFVAQQGAAHTLAVNRMPSMAITGVDAERPGSRFVNIGD